MYDVVVIGLGIVGASAARELARYDLHILGIDAGDDFASGATKANSGIVHAGHDALPGTNKAKYNVRGNAKYDKWSEELDFPFQRNGSLVLCRSKEDLPLLRALYDRGRKNGVPGLELIEPDQVYAMEPNLTRGIAGALYAATGGITCPYEFCIACGENARENGVEFLFNCKVDRIVKKDQGYLISAGEREFRARAVFNAAGVYSDEINNMVSEHKLKIQPRKGEYLLLDNTAGAFFHSTLFNLPTKEGKGVLISPTVDGNLFFGPNSEAVLDREDTATTRAGMDDILEKTFVTWNEYPKRRFITQFAGQRAHLEGEDFVVGEALDAPGFFNAVGVESPGLTSAPAIAEELSGEIAKYCGARRKEKFQPIRKAISRFRTMTDEERRCAIQKNPMYGNIICRCEKVTEAEVVEAIRRGAASIDAVKRRTRAGMGKCQGGFCTPPVLEILARELGKDPREITLDGPGTNLLVDEIQ